MSSTPLSAAGPGGKPPGSGPAVKKRRVQNDPFFKGPKKPTQPVKAQPNGHSIPQVNGHLPPSGQALQSTTLPSQRAASPDKVAIPPEDRVSGFSDAKVTAGGVVYKDYKLVTTKRDLMDGLRYHLMQITTDGPLDVRNEADFTKPARLHRRDPNAMPLAPTRDEEIIPKDGLNAAEREDLNRRKEIRQKEREANLAQIAPSQNTSRKFNNLKKKTQQVFRAEFSAADKRRIQTNYEEKLPWHLEDFDNKHCLVGHNQIGSTSVHAAFLYETGPDESSPRFRLIPVEKVYQFKPKREIVQKMTIEEVEATMKKRGSEPEWLIRQKEARLAEAAKDLAARRGKGLFSGAQTQNIAGRSGEEADLDFDDDFADDEEGDLFVDKDEDEKLAEKKIKEDQLTANFLDFKDLKEYDEAEAREKREAEARKKNFKEIRKALERRERNYNHGSDSEYASSTDSEEERERLEKEKQANIKKEEDADGKKESGANTPSGRKEKISGTASDREGGLQKSSSSKSLKRPGSPNLSDASGTDASTRKKKLKSRHLSSTQPASQSSRPVSSGNAPFSSAPALGASSVPSSSKKRKSGIGGSGSDTDAGSNTGRYSDRDGGAMSDGTRAKRLKLKMGGSQPTSRAGSPPAPAAAAAIGSPSSPLGNPVALPTIQDVKNAIPPEGIAIKDIIKLVAHPKEKRSEFVALVKEVAKMDKDRGVLVLK